MPLFRIERPLPAPLATEEMDAAAFRAITCLHHFKELKWIRSFYDPARAHFTCYYEAQSADDLRKHAELAQIPCASVTAVTEYLPEAYQ